MKVMKKVESSNTTLNMPVSLDGPEYYNIVDGATNTVQFLQFFFVKVIFCSLRGRSAHLPQLS